MRLDRRVTRNKLSLALPAAVFLCLAALEVVDLHGSSLAQADSTHLQNVLFPRSDRVVEQFLSRVCWRDTAGCAREQRCPEA
jgi:hypothetical protein